MERKLTKKEEGSFIGSREFLHTTFRASGRSGGYVVGQKVIYKNNDFDAVKRNIPCVVKEIYPDHIIITDTETDTDLWIEEGLNMDCVFPDYNMIGG